ncbi:MAG: hypothetical protein V1720_09720 [bacterium]
MSKIKKHIILFYKAFLLFYIFFLGFAGLHQHALHFYTDKNHVTIHKEIESDFFDPFMDENSVCRLVSFASMLYNNEQPVIFNSDVVEQSFKSISFLHKPDTKFLTTASLRAPPAK